MILEFLPHARDAKYVLARHELKSVEWPRGAYALRHAARALFVWGVFTQAAERGAAQCVALAALVRATVHRPSDWASKLLSNHLIAFLLNRLLRIVPLVILFAVAKTLLRALVHVLVVYLLLVSPFRELIGCLKLARCGLYLLPRIECSIA